MIEYAIFLRGLAQQLGALKFGTKVARGMRMMPEHEIHAQHRKACDTTLDDEKYDVHYSGGRPVDKNMTGGT